MPALCSHEGGGAWPGGVGGLPPGPLGGGVRSMFGDGRPYGNISGAASYDAASGTWTVTGTASVDISSETGAAVLACKRLIVTSTGVLTVATNCKGLLVFASVSVQVQAGGRVNIDKKGKAGNFGDLTPYDLAPTLLKRRLKADLLAKYLVLGNGALGGLGTGGGANANYGGNPGSAATSMKTGGGGSGGATWGPVLTGNGGAGGPCCGGAGSGACCHVNGTNAGDFGGPPGASATDWYGVGGGAGDPPGTGTNGPQGAGYPADGAGGGLLMLIAPAVTIASGSVVSADGGNSGGGNCAGGAAGGGNVTAITKPGGYSNAGTVRAAGGVSGSATVGGGSGGVGSVNIFQDAA